MTSQDTYRARSQTVRQAARVHLLEIRRARLDKRAKARPGTSDETLVIAGEPIVLRKVAQATLQPANPEPTQDHTPDSAPDLMGQPATAAPLDAVPASDADDTTNTTDVAPADDMCDAIADAAADVDGDTFPQVQATGDQPPPETTASAPRGMDDLESDAIASVAMSAPESVPESKPDSVPQLVAPHAGTALPADHLAAPPPAAPPKASPRKATAKPRKPAKTAQTLPQSPHLPPADDAIILAAVLAELHDPADLPAMPPVVQPDPQPDAAGLPDSTPDMAGVAPRPSATDGATADHDATVPTTPTLAETPPADLPTADTTGAAPASTIATAAEPVAAFLPAGPDNAYPDSQDLHALPGAGPGLIWMLEQCGITTMQHLAESDPSDLIPRLGLVGQILNVQSWIDFARNRLTAQA